MSRTRIVKGKIYEKVGGDLKYYSEADITEIASEHYAEQSGKEISHTGNPSKPTAGEIKAKCLVQFRPHDKWSGEFGFDWIRMGDNDTGRRGDKYWYRDIIGRYRDTNKQLFQVYDGGKFKKENAQYNLLLKEFSLFNITWKKDIYVVPVLALMPNSKSKFTLKIEIKEEPKELLYKINSKYYKLNKYKISHTTVGKKTLYNDLEITNIATHSGYENLDVIAISNDGSEETVGRIRIRPNSYQHQKKITVALVKVFNSKGNFTSLNLESRKKEITKYLNQALIIPTFVTANIHINRLNQNQRKKFLDAYNSFGPVDDAVYEVLYDAMTHFDSKYRNYIKVFFIDDVAGGLYGKTFDIGVEKKSVIVLTSGFNDSTLAHEALHAMNLYHTFDNDSKFTFLNFETDNVMDYSDIENRKFPVISTYVWQWKILRDFLKTIQP